MKRLICMVAIGLLASASGALAQPSHYDGGLGFHRVEAPIGIRWWLTGQNIALDAGVTFASSHTRKSISGAGLFGKPSSALTSTSTIS